MPRVLIVDDEEALRLSLSYALAREGYSVRTASDGVSALEHVQAEAPDVIVLDLMLPGIDGMEVCRKIRESSDVPIVMLTARDQSREKIQGLSSGADDYVTKPFDTPELIARIGAVVRRRAVAQKLLAEDRDLVSRLEEMVGQGPAAPIQAAAATASEAHPHGKTATLSAAESALLSILRAAAGRVVTRTELIERVWGAGAQDGLTLLAVHIRTLREKLEDDPARPRLIVGVPGIGFRYDGDA
jgi:two-component system response regulator RegX3